ncbi:hypothetical protein Droror1_Dr00003563 [Drosera rotundifolia]
MASNRSILRACFIRLLICPLLLVSFCVSATSRRLFDRYFWPPISGSVPELLMPPILPSPRFENQPRFDNQPYAVIMPSPPPPMMPTFPVFQEPLLPPVSTFLPRYGYPSDPSVPTMPSTMPLYPFPPGIQKLDKKINHP